MGYPIYHSAYTAAQIEAAIGKGPRVNASGYWEVWNVATMAYESTGVGAGVTPPTVVTQVSQMTNHGYIYIYNGSETGYTAGYWYYWDGSTWVAGGAYQVAATDKTLTVADAAADAKAAGDAIGELKSALENITNKNNLFVDAPLRLNKYYGTSEETNTAYSYFSIGVTSGKTYAFRCRVKFVSRSGEQIASNIAAGSTFSATATETLYITVYNADRSDWAMTENPNNVYAVGNYDNLTLSDYILAQTLGEDESKTMSQKAIRDALVDVTISPSNTTFFHVSKNMIDPDSCVSDEYVNQNTGAFVSSTGYNRTGYIGVVAETTYVLRGESGALRFRYAFYNRSKTYITGAQLAEGNDMLVTAPANAAFIAVSIGANYAPHNWMLAEYTNLDKSFERFDTTRLMRKYLPPEDGTGLFFNLPEKIYATEGIELNVYFSALTENWEDYGWKISCSKGMQFERGFRFTPEDTDAGTYTFTVSMLTKDQKTVLRQKTASLIVTAASAGSGESKSIIVLGDSTTNNGTVIVKLHDDFDGDSMTISTLGTRGTSPNNHEGRAGWSLKTYFKSASVGDVSNPFYNPSTHTFDADYYFTNSGVSKPDWFFVNMGINDMFDMLTDDAATAKAEECAGYIEDIITSVQTASPSTLMGICVTIPPNESQDAFGKAYGANRQTRDRYKRNNLILAAKIITDFSDREANGIYVIPIFESLDTIYNMGMESIPVNSRNATTYDSPVGNGGVHPAESGYWQIADVYTAFLKGSL